jgi:hypothetical protein
MTERIGPTNDDYVIFRPSREPRTTLPQLTFLWYLAPLATGVGLIMIHIAIRMQPFEPSPWLVIFGGWLMVMGAGAFVAALAAGAVLRASQAAGPPPATGTGDPATS